MKKRFTLMMMVLCFLMSIPLKMMAETVTIHFVDEEGWSDNGGKICAYVYKGNAFLIKKWPGTECNDIQIVGGKKVATWTLNLGDGVTASEAGIVFNCNRSQYPAEGVLWKVQDGLYYYPSGKTSTTPPSEGSGSGGSTPDDTWAETENRLKGRVYTQGYYLAGNFFSFSGEKVTYDDAVFKFQQQKNDDEGNAIYKVEIPASVTAHAQIMSVNELGKAVKVYGPGSAYGIRSDNPQVSQSVSNTSLVSSTTFDEGTNYWNITSRNETSSEYTDGIYEVFITIDKTTGEPSKCEFKHVATKRVAYFISDAKNATALPVYDSRKGVDNGFSNKFYGTVSFSADHSYYVIANYVQDRNKENFINYTKDKYKTCKPNIDIVPTTNKLFLLGNGGLDFKDASPNNEFSPNEDPMKPGSYAGSFVAEFNPSNGVYEQTDTKKHLGIRGQVQKRIYGEIITSISMVGDAIPGTLKVDEKTGKEVWDYASTAADMTYDETDKCYKVTIVTTVDDNGKSKFRFVGNHKQNINWHEDTKDVASMKAKTPYTGGGDGHAATPYDPNKISYTSDNANPGEEYHIIWNRPAGRWTVRLYFYTYNVDGNEVTVYYYTITKNDRLELRDFDDVVYKSLDNHRNILLRGDYKYFRTWSSAKAWKISKDVDIFVVDGMTEGTDGKAKFTLKKVNADPTNTYNVIPSETGVILATKKTAADIDGHAEVRERASLTSYNTMVIPMEEYNPNAETTSTDYVGTKYTGTNLLLPLITAQVVPTKEVKEGVTYHNYLFGFYNAKKGLGVTEGYNDNDFLMGFWISKGTGAFYNNSAYLPIAETDVNKMGLGVSYNDFNPTTGAKKVPALFFDFANADDTTGIDEVVNTTVKNNDGKYYTLSGLQVEKPTAGGVYIHNGKKFVVR